MGSTHFDLLRSPGCISKVFVVTCRVDWGFADSVLGGEWVFSNVKVAKLFAKFFAEALKGETNDSQLTLMVEDNFCGVWLKESWIGLLISCCEAVQGLVC